MEVCIRGGKNRGKPKKKRGKRRTTLYIHIYGVHTYDPHIRSRVSVYCWGVNPVGRWALPFFFWSLVIFFLAILC